MPDWMQTLAKLIPVTYALRAMRLALLQGASFAEIQNDILALSHFLYHIVAIEFDRFWLCGPSGTYRWESDALLVVEQKFVTGCAHHPIT